MEVVKIGRQSYGRFFLSLLLRQSLFGVNNNIFLEKEIVRKTKKKTLIHIASTRRMKDIFSQNGECASSFQYKSPSNVPLMERTCAGKVFLTLKGKKLIGYVVDEDYDQWMIKLENDLCSTIWINSLKYSPIDGKYLNNKCNVNFNDYVVKFYEPIRILLYTNGKCSCTMNRLEVNNEGFINYFNSS